MFLVSLVDEQVCVERRTLCERLGTHMTHIVPLSCMCEDVVLERSISFKSTDAVRTFEFAFSVVLHVTVEVRLKNNKNNGKAVANIKDLSTLWIRLLV